MLATGLFVEHYQKYNVIWNGQGGRTIFFQNELPYDPPNQAAWMNGTTNGYAAYKVANTVTSHEAWGMGSYCYFNANPSVVAARGFEVPVNPNVRFHNIMTVSLGGVGVITNVINTTGGRGPGHGDRPQHRDQLPVTLLHPQRDGCRRRRPGGSGTRLANVRTVSQTSALYGAP